MTIPVPKPPLTGYLTPPKLGLMKISGACIKNCPVLGFIASKIGFNEDFRRLRQSLPNTRLRTPQNWVLRRFQVVASKTARCHATYGHVASRKFSPLAAGDGGNREGPAKKAPCGWLGHAHRAEDKTVERRLAISGLGAARAAWPQGGANRGSVSMI